MNTEKLIAKGVEKHFDGQKVLFKVDSLQEYFDGLQIHESDIVEIQEEVKSDDDGTEKQFVAVQYVIAADVNFDNATANEVAPKVESGVLVDEIEVAGTEEVIVPAETIISDEVADTAQTTETVQDTNQ